MDVYKIKIYPTAKQDLREIIDYLNTLSQQAALRYYDLLIAEIESLSKFQACLIYRNGAHISKT